MQLRLKRLEDRIVFDAAGAAADNADAPSADMPDDGADRLVLVDKALDGPDGIALPDDGAVVVEFDSRTDSLRELQDLITAACCADAIDSIVFAGYGSGDGTAMPLEAVLALAGSADTTDMATFLEHLSNALADHDNGTGTALDPDFPGADLEPILGETTGMTFAAASGPDDGDAADAVTYGADDDGDGDDDDDVAPMAGDENYIEDNGIIRFEESDRLIGVPSGFWDTVNWEIGRDPDGQAHRLQLEFTLYKNDTALNLSELLAFQNEVLPGGDNIIYMTIDDDTHQVYGAEFVNGKFVLTLYYVTTDAGGESLDNPYYAVMLGDGLLVDVHRFFDGDGVTQNVIFGVIPDGTTSDVFTLQLQATAATKDGVDLSGTYDKSINVKFPVDTDDGDDDGDITDPADDNYLEAHDIVRFEESNRYIESGSAFLDPDNWEIGDDPGGQANRLVLEFTLYKGDEIVDLFDILGFQGEINRVGDSSYYLKVDGVSYSTSGIQIDNGKLIIHA
ncbi:MAG: hypothetical protein LIQ31_02140 [Planctomycetes bacterium]|nr:hypothetical protein [Planctomycetota bacterium]